MISMNIFDFIYPKYKITKPIRLIELFSGYGSQALALKYLGVNFEHHKTCEWAVKSIQAYKDCHFPTSNVKFNDDRTKEEMVDFLFKLGISQDYNEPMSREQISRLKEGTLKDIIKNIGITNNLVNICNVSAKDLNIIDKDKYEYIMTYSFPCQDLSVAGKGKGMSRDSNTRSGMLWEVERILGECKDIGSLPQILLMENVPQVIGSNNVDDFNEWQYTLESLGYKNYHQNLIATDYGIPQIRNRTFMVSILGEYSYSFPEPIPLKLKLKDMLEKDVDNKYYLSKKMLDGMMKTSFESYKLENKLLDNEGNANTILARFDGSPQVVGTYQYSKSENFMKGKDRFQKNKEVSDTLQTTPKEAVVLKEELCNSLIENRIVKENDVIKHSYTGQIMDGNKKCIEMNNLMPTMTTRPDCLGVVVKDNPKVIGGIGNKKSNKGTQWYQQDRIYDNKVGISVTTSFNPYYTDNNLRIRKLTPKECFRLMGVEDEDFENIAKNQSDSSLYHLAGDSIASMTLVAIFGELLGINWQSVVERWENDIKSL